MMDKTVRNKRRLIKWIKIIVIIYCSIGIALYYLQEKFLFHPVKLDSNYTYQFDMPFKEINIPFNKIDTINLVKFFPKDAVRKGVVIYFHGNKENITRYAKFSKNFTTHGYEVWMEDYPGFGKSTGEITEKKLYEQAWQIYAMAKNLYGNDSIIIYGKSFGTGLAAYVAANGIVKRLILETPYYSIPDLFSCYAPVYPTSLMSTYKIPTYKYLEDVKVPVTIFHGTGDGVIPYRCAKKLKPILKPADEFITIPEGTHHNLNDFDLMKNKLDSLLNL
jgi:alpha-beta hydrolase superfamily lysophospholipase